MEDILNRLVRVVQHSGTSADLCREVVNLLGVDRMAFLQRMKAEVLLVNTKHAQTTEGWIREFWLVTVEVCLELRDRGRWPRASLPQDQSVGGTLVEVFRREVEDGVDSEQAENFSAALGSGVGAIASAYGWTPASADEMVRKVVGRMGEPTITAPYLTELMFGVLAVMQERMTRQRQG